MLELKKLNMITEPPTGLKPVGSTVGSKPD